MSYILDALKRADTERERGAAPGLHTRHQMPAGNAGTPSERPPVWMAAAAGLTLVVLAIVFWFWRTPDAPPMAALQPAASPMPNRIAPEQPAVSASPVPPAAPVAPVTPVAPRSPPAAITPIAPVPIVVAEAPVAKAKPVEKTSPKVVTTPPAIPTVPAASTGAVAEAPAAKPASTASAVPTTLPTSARPASTTLLSDLPAELRSQIPKITITGSVYSDSPAQRLLLVNNLVLPQGSQVTPDLKLEEIQPRSSVFSYKGNRFRLMH
ncbi:MAG TPA: general secretion pathway protein GspB [Rhodoferax sp.]|nr:general secretion pathway protein GspB [Rhodoferax sp.]